jgi:hypothetical protein
LSFIVSSVTIPRLSVKDLFLWDHEMWFNSNDAMGPVFFHAITQHDEKNWAKLSAPVLVSKELRFWLTYWFFSAILTALAKMDQDQNDSVSLI